MRPSEAIRGTRSTRLDGVHIALGVTGSVAAIETVKLARELIRHGAHVRAYATRSACNIVGEDALAWATGHPVVTRLTGEVEHLGHDGGPYQVVCVAPATANMLAKTSQGIADDPVSTLVQAHLGRSSIVMAPAMHTGMEANPALQEAQDRLERMGVDLVPPIVEEDEAKLAPFTVTTEHVLRAHGPRPLDGKRVLVVNGSTIEPIDRMRVITNKSTGRQGFAIARAAYRLGADVELWLGHHHGEAPAHLDTRRFTTVADLLELAPDAADRDLILVPAAISDFGVEPTQGKLPSNDAQTLDLKPLPKVVPALRKACPDGRVIGWKAEGDLTDEELLDRGRAWLGKNGVDAVIANRLEDVDVDTTRACILQADEETWAEGTKTEVAERILEALGA